MNTQTQEALEMAIEALRTCETYNAYEQSFETILVEKAIQACKEALEAEQVCQHSRVRQNEVQPAQEPKCSNHPDAPHGFCRDASHSADRYVCECEEWEVVQPAQEPVAYEPTSQEQSVMHKAMIRSSKLVYKAHPAPSWQGLSDYDILSIDGLDCVDENNLIIFARAIEAKLKENNK